MQNYICPSIMCGDWMNFKKTIQDFEENRIDYIHLDIMDGEFVPNYTLGTDMIKALHKITNIPLDIHLMVVNPEKKIDYFELFPDDIITFHIEAAHNPSTVIAKAKSKGCKVGIALSPDTSVQTILPYLDQLDLVTVMSVYPGFAGQALIPHTLDKLPVLSSAIQALNKPILLEVDGNVSFENARKMKEMGANAFVTGSSSLFHKDHSFKENMEHFLSLIN